MEGLGARAGVNTNADREAVMTKSMTDQPRSPSPDLSKWVKPQLCKLVDAPPKGPEWLHEIKYDGYLMHPAWTTAGSRC
jgi:ATP-dependent DNA ligase